MLSRLLQPTAPTHCTAGACAADVLRHDTSGAFSACWPHLWRVLQRGQLRVGASIAHCTGGGGSRSSSSSARQLEGPGSLCRWCGLAAQRMHNAPPLATSSPSTCSLPSKASCTCACSSIDGTAALRQTGTQAPPPHHTARQRQHATPGCCRQTRTHLLQQGLALLWHCQVGCAALQQHVKQSAHTAMSQLACGAGVSQAGAPRQPRAHSTRLTCTRWPRPVSSATVAATSVALRAHTNTCWGGCWGGCSPSARLARGGALVAWLPNAEGSAVAQAHSFIPAHDPSPHTSAPRPSSSSATARPMPRVPPVTRHRCPARPKRLDDESGAGGGAAMGWWWWWWGCDGRKGSRSREDICITGAVTRDC